MAFIKDLKEEVFHKVREEVIRKEGGNLMNIYVRVTNNSLDFSLYYNNKINFFNLF